MNMHMYKTPLALQYHKIQNIYYCSHLECWAKRRLFFGPVFVLCVITTVYVVVICPVLVLRGGVDGGV